jgi:hypothetical protein
MGLDRRTPPKTIKTIQKLNPPAKADWPLEDESDPKSQDDAEAEQTTKQDKI